MRKLISIHIMVILAIIALSCSSKKDTMKGKSVINDEKDIAGMSSGPKLIIYKTSGDYYDKVPVTLSEDKSGIVSYPGKDDVYYKGSLSYPTRLINGFLMDNRGIDQNSAFLEYTYEEYSNLDKTPLMSELFEKIVDADPFVEMYNCGSRYDYKDPVREINDIIEANNLDKFTRLK